MGVVCCNNVTSEKAVGEINCVSTLNCMAILSNFLASQTEQAKKRCLFKSKTCAKKEQNSAVPRIATDAIHITPSQFILENSKALGSTYQFSQKLGQGSTFYWSLGTYGTVYKVVHKVTKEKRATKLIQRNSVPKGQEGNLLSEIKVLKELVQKFLIHRITRA